MAKRQETGVSKRPDRVRQSRHALRRKSDKKGRQEGSRLTSCWLGTCILASYVECTNCTAIGKGRKKRVGDPEHVGRVNGGNLPGSYHIRAPSRSIHGKARL